MYSKKLVINTLLIIVAFLAACTPTAATPVTTEPPNAIPPTAIPPTPTLTPTKPPTAIPPTATPITLITDPALLIGKWDSLSSSADAMFLLINADGTCRQSYTLAGLDGTPEVECTYKFEGDRLVFTAVKLNGVPACPSPTGSYQVQALPDNQIKLIKAEDTCAPRVKSTAGRYQRLP